MRRASILGMITAGVAVVLLIVSGTVLLRGHEGTRLARSRRDKAYRELEKYHAMNPFPSGENIQQAQTNLLQMRLWYTNLFSSMAGDAIDSADQSPSIFIDRLQSMARELYLASPRYGGEPVVAPPFAFGFAPYLNEGGMPIRENVPRLTRQMLMVQRLVRTFFDTGAAKVQSLERDPFETAAGPENQSRSGPGRRQGRDPVRREVRFGSAGIPAEIERFKVNLQIRQQALVDLLNRFSTLSPFVVVNDLNIRKDGQALRKAPPEKKAGEPGGASRSVSTGRSLFGGLRPEEPAETPETEIDPREIPRDERLVAGPQLEPLLDVRLEIVFFNFNRDLIRAEQ